MRPSYVPKTLAQMTASWFVASPEEAAEATRSSANAIKRLEQNGVPWALGADEGNSPAYTTFFHGVASQIELEALETVGIPPDRLIAAATTTPAKMLGVSHRLGTIEVGKQADLIILEDNPLTEGMKAFRTLEWTIAKGHARTPAAWLTK
ncbi:MAG: amidohydrolase family protein, partial [Bradymonadia bacterium]